MTFQYALRFESGERRGETVPISAVAAPGGAFTIGRNPGNTLQVVDASVSGRHAELEISKEGVELRDLDSTNGTLVGGRKVRAMTLLHGDEFAIGAVQFTIIDGSSTANSGGIELEEPIPHAAPMPSAKPKAPKAAPRKAPAPAPSSAGAPAPAGDLGNTAITPREDSIEITAEDLARSKRSSLLGPIVLVGLAAAGGAAWFFLGRGGSDDGGSAARRTAAAPVSAPSGNLLTKGYSFEQAQGWTSGGAETDAQFDVVGSAALSGRRGLRAELTAGDSATLVSDPVRVTGSRTVRAVGHAAAAADAELRIGLRFLGAGDAQRATVWSAPVSGAEAFEEVGVIGTAPGGMDRVQVLVRASSKLAAPSGEGDAPAGDAAIVDVDDVALVPATSTAHASKTIGTWTASLAGGDTTGDGKPTSIALSQVDQVHVSQIGVASDGTSPDVGLDIAFEDGRATITPAANGTLVVRVEPTAVDGGLATMGASGGYAGHGTTFERDGATDLLVGDGGTLVRLALGSAAAVTGRPSGDAVLLRAPVTAGAAITLQLDFQEERTRALRLDRRADEARRSGESARALDTWTELLNEVPFDRGLVDRATVGQSEILAKGRDDLGALAEEVERARFFGLADLYREKRARAEELAAQYRGSAVATACQELCDKIDAELATLDSGSSLDEAKRLEGIRAVLEASGASSLAEKVSAARDAKAPNGLENTGSGTGDDR